ncbi:hypothetical protein BC567DRAFT_66116 [Phyllosticta citribraziliensis]
MRAFMSTCFGLCLPQKRQPASATREAPASSPFVGTLVTVSSVSAELQRKAFVVRFLQGGVLLHTYALSLSGQRIMYQELSAAANECSLALSPPTNERSLAVSAAANECSLDATRCHEASPSAVSPAALSTPATPLLMRGTPKSFAVALPSSELW